MICKTSPTSANIAVRALAGIPPLDLLLPQLLVPKFLSSPLLCARVKSRWRFPHLDLIRDSAAKANLDITWEYDHTSKLHCSTNHSIIQLINEPPPPRSPGFLIFTDGSKTSYGVGSAFVVMDPTGTFIITSWRGKLPSYCTIYQAELLAIQKACSWIKANSPAHIWSDSLSSLHSIRTALVGTPLLKLVVESWPAGVVAAYIPAHRGYYGNELADQLAKQAILHGEPIHLPVSKGHVKQSLKTWAFTEWTKRWANYSPTTSPIKQFFPSLQLIKRSIWSKGAWYDSICKLFLGRSPLAGDHWWVEDDTSFECYCHDFESTSHFLFDCPLHAEHRSTWDLSTTLPVSAKFEWLGHRPTEVKQFIDATGRFHYKNPMFQDFKARFDHCFTRKPPDPNPLPAELV